MNQGDGETIGLIAAMTQESAALLRCVKHWERIGTHPWPRFTFTLSGKSCVLITSGMGTRRASEAARYLLETSSPQRLISFGIAGALGADLEVGDVILPDRIYRWEQGKLTSSFSIEPWTTEAREAAEQVLARRGRHLYQGAAITTGGAQVMESQVGGIPHPVLEMETAGIARIAAEKGVPLRALRAISDGPRAPLPFDLGKVFDDDANLLADKLLKEVIRNPKLLFQSRQLMRNINVAAECAAIALLAALGEGSE